MKGNVEPDSSNPALGNPALGKPALRKPALSGVRALELFAGIGGFSVACQQADVGIEVISAVDIDQTAREVFRANFETPYRIGEIASLSLDWLQSLAADLWWMSPPCQPFSIRGSRQEGLDPRANALWRLIEWAKLLRPRLLLLENVPGFRGSDIANQLEEAWTKVGYQLHWLDICPSQFGWPNLRRRCYLVAILERTFQWMTSECRIQIPSLEDCLLPADSMREDRELWLDDEVISRFGGGLDRLSLPGWQADSNVTGHQGGCLRTACFGSSYGRSMKHAGSYLMTPDGWRRFHPREVARLLGIPDTFRFPDLPHRTLYRLLGNSLSIPSVHWILQGLSQSLEDPSPPSNTA